MGQTTSAALVYQAGPGPTAVGQLETGRRPTRFGHLHSTCRMHRRLATAAAAPALRRFSHHSAPPRPDPRLAFLRSEVDDLDLSPSHKPSPRPPHREECQVLEELRSGLARAGDAPAAVDIAHPWPEWVALMELLLRRGHVDPSAFASASLSSKDANAVRTACLQFGRQRPELIR